LLDRRHDCLIGQVSQGMPTVQAMVVFEKHKVLACGAVKRLHGLSNISTTRYVKLPAFAADKTLLAATPS
jgi:hypothetical protein